MEVVSQVLLAELAKLDAASLPSEVPLFKFGENRTSKGVFLLDEKGAQSVLDTYKKNGVELHFDYEHDQRNAAAWFVPEVRADGIWATSVRWTPRAAEMLKGREYRYTSPTFWVDSDKRITRLVNVALTNLPATEKAPALVAASESAPNRTERNAMPNGLATVIGLKDDASEDQISERVIALAGIERRLLDATGATSLADAMTVVLSHKDAASERDQYKQMCREWQERHDRGAADEKRKAIDAIIHGAILDGRVSLKDTDRLDRWKKHGEEYGAEQLAKLVAERDPRPVRQFQAPQPANSVAEQMRAIEEYKKANPGSTTGDAYVALAATRPALFTEEVR